MSALSVMAGAGTIKDERGARGVPQKPFEPFPVPLADTAPFYDFDITGSTRTRCALPSVLCEAVGVVWHFGQVLAITFAARDSVQRAGQLCATLCQFEESPHWSTLAGETHVDSDPI